MRAYGFRCSVPDVVVEQVPVVLPEKWSVDERETISASPLRVSVPSVIDSEIVVPLVVTEPHPFARTRATFPLASAESGKQLPAACAVTLSPESVTESVMACALGSIPEPSEQEPDSVRLPENEPEKSAPPQAEARAANAENTHSRANREHMPSASRTTGLCRETEHAFI